MLVHVLLYKVGEDEEGIHSIDIRGKTIVLMFEDKDDADRYCGLLEAQDFPVPSVELLDKEEISTFCNEAGYESKFIEKGFLPITEEDRFFISPPERNLEYNVLSEDMDCKDKIDNRNSISDNKLDEIRNNLEKLL